MDCEVFAPLEVVVSWAGVERPPAVATVRIVRGVDASGRDDNPGRVT